MAKKSSKKLMAINLPFLYKHEQESLVSVSNLNQFFMDYRVSNHYGRKDGKCFTIPISTIFVKVLLLPESAI